MLTEVSTDLRDYDTSGIDVDDPNFRSYWKMMTKQSAGWSGGDERKKLLLQGKLNAWKKRQENARKQKQRSTVSLNDLGMNNISLAALDSGLNGLMGGMV
jgi:hypothetical protein